jgi:hypothetical protein
MSQRMIRSLALGLAALGLVAGAALAQMKTIAANPRSRSTGKAAVAKSAKPSSNVISTRRSESGAPARCQSRKSWQVIVATPDSASTSMCMRNVSGAMLVGPGSAEIEW